LLSTNWVETSNLCDKRKNEEKNIQFPFLSTSIFNEFWCSVSAGEKKFKSYFEKDGRVFFSFFLSAK
jgi:hypothetical protein